MKYRKDHRTKKQFIKDIKECTLIETELMDSYTKWLNSRNNGVNYTFIHNGVDNSGSFIPDCKNVTSDADFSLIRIRDTEILPERKIEIKFSRKINEKFHIKTSQAKSYIKNDVCLVVFMDIENSEHKFTILTPKILKEKLETGPIVKYFPWGGKECIEIKREDVKWNKVSK